jgi:hypothetical protein
MWASDKGLCRPTDLAVSRGNPSKAILVPFAFAKRLEEKRLPAQRGYANERLGWVAKHKIADTIDRSITRLQNISKFMPLYLVILVRMIG